MDTAPEQNDELNSAAATPSVAEPQSEPQADTAAGADTGMTDAGPSLAEVTATMAHRADFPQFTDDVGTSPLGNIDLLMDVKLPVSIELGRTTLPIGEILKWGQGSIIELDKLAGEPVNLLVNNILVAKGEVVVVDENFGLRITSLVPPKDRAEQH